VNARRILRRAVRIVGWAAAGVAALVLLAGIAVALLVGTSGGTRFLFARLGALMPGTFAVQSTAGRIDSPLTLRGVTYKRPGLAVTIDRLYLEWDLRAVLARRVDVRRLYADGVHVITTPTPSTEPTKLPDLDLHFNVVVRDARVRGLTVGSVAAAAGDGNAAPSAASVTRIDEIDLKTSDLANRVRIDRLAVRSPELQADVTGTIQPQGDYPVDLEVRWAVHPSAAPGQPRIAAMAGSGRLSGTLESLHVTQAVTAPFAVQVAAVLSKPLRDLSFDGRVAFDGVNPRRLRADLPDLPASGVVAARGTLDHLDSSGTLEGSMAPAGRFHLDYQLARRGDAWQVQRADVTLPGTPARASLSGRVALPSAPGGGGLGALDVDLRASWRDATWPPRGKPSFASPSGEAHVTAHASHPPAPSAGGGGTGQSSGESGAGSSGPHKAAGRGPSFATAGGGPSNAPAGSGTGVPAGSSGSGTARAASGSLLDGNLSSEGTVQAVIATVGPLSASYRVTHQGGDWRIERLDLAVPGTPAHLSATGRVAQRGPQVAIDAQASWRDLSWPLAGPPAWKSAQGQAQVAGDLDHFTARVAAAVTPGPAAAAASGTVAAPSGRTAAASGPAGAASPRAATGAASATAATGPSSAVSGGATPVSAGSAAGGATGSAGALPAGSFVLSGSGSRDRFHIDSLTADLLSGHVQGRGDVAWSPELQWNVTISAQGIDPTAVRPDFPGRLAFDVATHGQSGANGLSGAVELSRLQGTLRGQPVSASAAVALSGPVYNVPHLDAQWGTARLQASGRLGANLDLGFDASTSNLGLLVSGAAGSLTAKGHLSGPAATPRVQATAKASALRFGTQSAGAVNLQADVDLAAAGPFQIDADVHDLAAGGQLVSHLTLTGRGTASSHTLTLAVAGLGDSKSATVALGLAGGISGPLGAASIWRGRIERLDVRSSPIGDWGLEQAATLEAGAKELALHDLCWARSAAPAGTATKTARPAAEAGGATKDKASGTATAAAAAGGAKGGGAAVEAGNGGGGRICASAAWSQAGTWAGEAQLAALPLGLIKPLLPPDLAITGVVNGKAEAHGGSKGLAGADIDVTPGPGELRFPGDSGRTVTVRFDQGHLRAQAGPAGGTATAELALPGTGTFDAQLRLPRLTEGVVLRDQPLSGKVAVHVHDLSVVEGFVPELRKLTGTLDADLTLSGTAGTPRVAGQARLAGAGAQVPLYGLTLKDVAMTATGNGGTTLAIDASAKSGPGSVHVTGSAGLMPGASEPLHLLVTGNRFAVEDTRDIRILVSPKLDLTYSGSAARVTGDVTVPEAHIHVESAGKAGPITPSKDVVFVGAQRPNAQQPAAAPLAVSAHIRLILPNPSVELDAMGLKGQPYGQLLIVEDPARQTTGTGELDIAKGGIFQAYGQNLTIERGRLVFGGPIGNPALDIRASRLSDDQTVTAGIEAKGTLEKPEISVWSTPAMGESDALAYVVLGHGLNSASQQEGNRVANAATSLGLSGAGLLAKNIGARFGLEEASIETSGNLNQASLMLGKFLAPHLYVVYGIGLFQPVSTFRVRYILSSKWTLQAESSSETGADILYTLERGKTRSRTPPPPAKNSE
jgi:translocation and assembly module TamB